MKAHIIFSIALLFYVAFVYSHVDETPEPVLKSCPEPFNSTLIKDCEFQTDGICRFVSIYDYQRNVRVAIARGDL